MLLWSVCRHAMHLGVHNCKEKDRTKRALHHDTHRAAWGDAKGNEVMRQLVGACIHLPVAELLALKDKAWPVRPLSSPVLKDLVHRLSRTERWQSLGRRIQPFQHLQAFKRTSSACSADCWAPCGNGWFSTTCPCFRCIVPFLTLVSYIFRYIVRSQLRYRPWLQPIQMSEKRTIDRWSLVPLDEGRGCDCFGSLLNSSWCPRQDRRYNLHAGAPGHQ